MVVVGVQANKRLFWFAVCLLVLNVIATLVAIAVNWPSQFGQVGTDADKEFLAKGTAISAPLAPVVCLIVVVLLARRENAWGWVAVVAAYATAAMFSIGGVGEFVGEPTVDTPKAVLVVAAVAWLVVAVLLALAATSAAVERIRRRRQVGSAAVS
ncbi:MAG: hypothetical protein M3423_01125 [Actinomycetota bacterium]|nr:hypothetical protein [Actinomycetota bacterium]